MPKIAGSEITRRAFVTTTLATTALALTPVPARAAAGPRSRVRARDEQDVQVQQGNASVTVTVLPAQDVTEIDYTITNVGSFPDTFTIWYSDLNNGRESRKLSYPLNPGASASAEVYGRVNHDFLVNVCQSDGTCFTVGPVGPGPQVVARGVRMLRSR